MNTRKIVITGGPGTGKSTVIEELKKQQLTCFEEISRQIIQKAQEEGIEQLFLNDPYLFSKKLIESRLEQYRQADNIDEPIVFFDRGLPDVNAYLQFVKQPIPDEFDKIIKEHPYDKIVFMMPPWEEIFTTDAERYESFNQSQLIHNKLVNYYKELGYYLIFVPFGNVEKRVEYILDSIKKHS